MKTLEALELMLIGKRAQLNWQPLSTHGLKKKRLFQTILFPVDFSPACSAAAPYVRDLAKLTGGTVTLLHVIPSRSAWYGAADLYTEPGISDPVHALKNTQMSKLAAFQARHFRGIPCELKVECGCIGSQIVEFGEHIGADLIIMPSHESGDSARPVRDAALAHVLREAPCPVWTTAHSAQLGGFANFHSIVCALSPDAICGHYVNETVALARVFDSRLTFVSAAPPRRSREEESRVLSIEEEFPEAGLDQLVSGSTLPVYVERGPVGEVVRHIAQIQSADLVVINRPHRSVHCTALEGHAREIVLQAPCPVLLLPTRAAASLNIPRALYSEPRHATPAACC